jgi:hypothetical protein
LENAGTGLRGGISDQRSLSGDEGVSEETSPRIVDWLYLHGGTSGVTRRATFPTSMSDQGRKISFGMMMGTGRSLSEFCISTRPRLLLGGYICRFLSQLVTDATALSSAEDDFQPVLQIRM